MKESENFLFCQNLLSMNSFTLPLVGNSTTLSTTLNCPPLTQPTADGYACEYTTWAYALFAIVAIIIAGIPFVVFVCYVHRKVKKKKQEARARGRGYSGSFESSSPYPYQVRDNHGNNNSGRRKNIQRQATATKIDRNNNNFLPAEFFFLCRFCWA